MSNAFPIAALLLVAVMGMGCSANPTPAAPSSVPIVQGAQFQLGVGEEGVLASGKLSVTFVRVTSDSRCPKAVTCVWAGEAAVVLRVVQGGQPPAEFDLTLAGDGVRPGMAQFDGYVLKLLALDPYPINAGDTRQGDYVVTLLLARP